MLYPSSQHYTSGEVLLLPLSFWGAPYSCHILLQLQFTRALTPTLSFITTGGTTKFRPHVLPFTSLPDRREGRLIDRREINRREVGEGALRNADRREGF